MARYFKYTGGIVDNVVLSINLYKFNEEVRISDGIVEVKATYDQIIEWIGMQNVDLIELTVDEAMAWRMDNLTLEVFQAMEYLSSTDYKMTVDYYGSMTPDEQVIISTARDQARNTVRTYKAGI